MPDSDVPEVSDLTGGDATAGAAELDERYERSHDPTRVLFLSDGVCAIILTLLVLDVHLPEGLQNNENLVSALHALRPSLVAFAISFVVVAIAWVEHRDLYSVIRRTDVPLVWLNFLYLMPLCLLPFGASLLAHYSSDAVSLRIYGVLLIAIALTRIWIWLYATGHPHLLVGAPDPRFRRTGVLVAGVPAMAYLIAFAIAEAAPTGSMIIYGAVPAAYVLGTALFRSWRFSVERESATV